MSRNVFIETLCSLNSEKAYLDNVNKHGKPVKLQEELAEIGIQQFVPFMNKRFSKSCCVYDLGQLEDQYSETYDVTDNFKFDGDFICFYCEKKLVYGDFFTC